MTAFDLNLGIQVSFPAQVIDGGAITLPAKLLNDIVSRLPDEDITLSVDKDNTMVSIVCGSGRYQMNGLAVEEFPELPQIGEDGQTTYLPVESMLSGLASTLFATSADETKRILTGVHLTSDRDRLEFAATDGHRLAVVQTGFLDADEPPVTSDTVTTNLEVTIPARALRELERMLNQQTEGAIAVKFDQSNMIFQSANQILISRLLDGSYPNYRQLIPNRFERQVTLERKLFLSALEELPFLLIKKITLSKSQLTLLDKKFLCLWRLLMSPQVVNRCQHRYRAKM
jgi:DNA polymerase-3 subunit beta